MTFNDGNAGRTKVMEKISVQNIGTNTTAAFMQADVDS